MMRSKLSGKAALPPTFSFRGCSRERGFSLVEVLVTVAILCLGLLGVAGLQYLGMQSNQSALSRAIATEYAYQMLDFIRSNPVVTAHRTDTDLPPVCNPGMMCTPEAFDFTMAQSDAAAGPVNMQTIPGWINGWAVRLKEDLPNARAAVCRSSTQNVTNVPTNSNVDVDCNNGFAPWTSVSQNRYYVVTIRWKQSGTSFTDAEQQIILVGEVL
jgi:type IV pilus modification protein PilV